MSSPRNKNSLPRRQSMHLYPSPTRRKQIQWIWICDGTLAPHHWCWIHFGVRGVHVVFPQYQFTCQHWCLQTISGRLETIQTSSPKDSPTVDGRVKERGLSVQVQMEFGGNVEGNRKDGQMDRWSESERWRKVKERNITCNVAVYVWWLENGRCVYHEEI